MADKIRFAILCSGDSLSSAGLRMLDRLLDHQDVQCAAVLDIGHEPPPPAGWAWAPYRRWLASQPRSSIYSRFPDILKIDCPLEWDPSQGFYAVTGRSISFIESLNPDFIFAAAQLPLGGKIAGVARFGIWASFYGRDGNSYGGMPPAFGEFERGEPHIPVFLQRLGTPRQILRQGMVSAAPGYYHQSLDNAVAAGIDFPAIVVRQILKNGTLPVIGTHAAAAKPPSVRQVARYFGRLGLAWSRDQWSQTIRSEMWYVGIVNTPIDTFLNGQYPSQIDWLSSPGPRKYLADPFTVPSSGGIQLLMEEFDYEQYQGYIVNALYQPGRPLTEIRTIINEGIHMSYPFPVMHKGELYCIPESQRRREVSIYRMVQEDTPRWVRAGILLRDFAALDSTVIEHDGRWWLFCTCQDDLPECKLYLWHAPDLFGPWTPHALNPVKCDVRCTRPGGTPFIRDGNLYRPAQDSSTGYGSALSINRVLRLTPDEFEEELVANIKPPTHGAYPDGIHTLSAAGSMTVLDGKRMAVIWALAWRRLQHKFKRLAKLAF